AQGRSHTLTIQRLPAPLDVLELVVVAQQHLKELGPHARPLPGLKARMQTTTGTKPVLVQRLPLAAGAQHIQDPIQHLPVAQRRSPDRAFGLVRRQQVFDQQPQMVWHMPKCVITHATLLGRRVGSTPPFSRRSVFSFKSGPWPVYGYALST